MKKTTKRLTIVGLLMLICLTLCFAFACGAVETKKYTVHFYPDNGTAGYQLVLEEGQVITSDIRPANPTKEGDEKYDTYVFEGWYTEEGTKWDFKEKVTSDLNLTAKWKNGIAKEYTATVKYDYDEEKVDTVKYNVENKEAKFAEVSAIKPADNLLYTYTWKDLSKELPLKDVTYTVTREAVEYTATIAYGYKAETDEIIFNVENRADKLEEIKAKLPAKTAEYTYTWKDLAKELPLADCEYTVERRAVEYTATIGYDYKEYTDVVKYTVENRAEKFVEILGIVPAKTAEYSYELLNIPSQLPLKDIEFEVRRTVNKYSVEIGSNNTEYGTVSYSKIDWVPYGTVITTEGNKVTINGMDVLAQHKNADAQYTYTFEGWTNGTVTVIGDTTITANFTATVNKYTVKVASSNIYYGTVDVATVAEVPYGTVIKTIGNAVIINGTKATATANEETEEYRYIFANWTNGTATVEGATTVTANFIAKAKIFDVTFDSNGGTPEYETQRIKEGKLATKPETDPTREGDEGYDAYTFLGWYNGETEFDFSTPITKDITLKAEWEVGQAIEHTATISYNYKAGSEEIKFTIENRADKLAEIKNLKPADDAQYAYTFNPELPETLPLEDVEYTVTRTAVEYTATVSFEYGAPAYKISFTVENRTEKLNKVKALKPADGKDYTYSWKEELPEELPLKDVEFTVTRTAVEYTAKVTYDYKDGFNEVKFTVENRADKLAEIKNLKPADDAQYAYTFNPEVPTELELNNYEFVVERVTKTYNITVNREFEGIAKDPYVYEDIEYGKELDLAELEQIGFTYKLYNGEEEISAYTVTGEATLKAVYSYCVIDFEDGTNGIMDEVQRKASAKGTGHTLEVVDFTGTSDKINGKALKIVTLNQDNGDIAILDSYLTTVFSDPNVSAIAFDVYLETQVNAESIDIRMSTSSTDANTNYRYLYPKQGETGTILYTREIYNQKSKIVYNGFRQFFFNRWADTFYIDNIRVCKGSVQDNYYYGFEQTCIRSNGGTNLLYASNTPTAWQVRAGGGTYAMSIDTDITNNSAASLKIDYTANSGEKQFVFQNTSVAWYTALKGGFSFDIYSTIDIPYNQLVNNAYKSYGISLKANTWNTVYVSANDISGTACIYRIKDGVKACTIYLDNLKPITEDEYNQAILGIEAGRLRDDVEQTYYYYSKPDIITAKYSIAVVGSTSATISAGTFDGITHSGIHSFGCTKSTGYISYISNPESDFYNRIKNGFTVWVYSTVEIDQKYVKDGVNGLLSVTIPANTWTQLTIPASGVNSGGRFLIIDAGSPEATIYLDDFAPLAN